MNKAGSAAKVKLNSFDDLFGASDMTVGTDQVQEIPLSELYEFKGHPFKVLDDEKMQETVESIRNYGVLMPGIARPRAEGGYEIIAGHRRKHGCELAGLSTMPMFIRDYNDDEATAIMVDTNIQREDILPSEKAKAYSMKYEAMKHRGKKGNGSSLDEVGEAAGESGKTVQRYIWLARLSDELLDMVDKKKIGLVQGVDISFLTEQAQEWVQVILEETGAAISTTQSSKLKEYGKNGELTLPMVRLILTEEKPKERKVTIKADKISRYFTEDYSSEDIENIIYAKKLQMLLQSCMRLRIYLLWMPEDTVLSSYSIIDRHRVLKMQLPLRIVGACLKTCGRNGLTHSFSFWQKEHQWQEWDIMRYSGVCQRRNKRNL